MMTQGEALNILKSGANVFLTGEPGSGKTHTVNEYVRYLRAHGVEPSITASTGIAATHIGGQTIHSWAGIGIKRHLDKYALDAIATNERVAKRIARSKALIIDEVSMLAPGTLDMVDAVCRAVRRSHESFGGLSVLLVGDFFQLPPVVTRHDLESNQSGNTGDTLFDGVDDDASGDGHGQISGGGRFAYQSSAWSRANFLTCYLSEQYRQEDKVLLDILSAIRRNEFNEEHQEYLERRKVKEGAGKMPENVPVLYSHNVDVDRLNANKLEQIKSDQKRYAMVSTGPEHLTDALKRGCLSPESLVLKVGASVMCTKNNMQARFVNGTQGVVTGFDKTSGWPVIRTRSGKNIIIEPMEWALEENGKVRARITQVPLRLSWAITVHKSQGMSMDSALMDLSGVFEHGQGYVALSRVRSLSGLHLLGWSARAFSVDPGVLSQDATFRAGSEQAQVAFASLPQAELATMHHNFIRASGGTKSKHLEVKSPSGEGKRYDVANIRAKHANAYQPWSADLDGKLINLHNSGLKIGEIAKELGRQTGSIRSRLKKHNLIS